MELYTPVLALALIYFLTCIPSYGITFFLPQIVKELGHTNFVTGLLSALPSVAGLCGLIVFGSSSDKRDKARPNFSWSAFVFGSILCEITGCGKTILSSAIG